MAEDGTQAGPPSGRRPRILLVDDDVVLVAALRALLASRGYEVETASDGARALEELGRAPFDVVLLDVGMPGQDGFRVCRRIQETVASPPAVVFLSADASVEARVRGLDLGAQDYVSKPFEPEELEARLRVALRTRSEREELAARGARDALTGLLNRGQLEERLAAAIAAAHRGGRPLSGCMLDVDGFKAVNDALGHAAGDSVLVETARRIEAAVRASDTPFRLGGDEFFVLVPDTPLERAAVLAERLRTRVGGAPFGVETPACSERLRVTVSIGVAAWRPRMDGRAFLAAADRALYEAKAAGRDRVAGAPARREARPARRSRAGRPHR